MDETELKELIEQLREWGVIFEKGLSSQEIKDIETEGKFRFPEDLRAFLQMALPIWEPDYENNGLSVCECFPNWRTRGSLLIRMSQRWLLKSIQFQVQDRRVYNIEENWRNGYWLEAWGPRPATLEEALATVEKAFAAAPILIPVYLHYFIPGEPIVAGNPVFSVMGINITHYSPNLTTFFHKEFGHQEPSWATSALRPIHFWNDFV